MQRTGESGLEFLRKHRARLPLTMTLYGMKIDPAPLGPFNAEAWVRSRLRDAPTLQPVTLHAVAGFALIWNLFEGLVRDHRANVAQFERVVVSGLLTPSFP